MLTIHGHRCVVLQKYFYRVIINEIIAINTRFSFFIRDFIAGAAAACHSIARFYLLAQIIAGEIILIQKNELATVGRNIRIVHPLHHFKCSIHVFIVRHKSFMVNIFHNRSFRGFSRRVFISQRWKSCEHAQHQHHNK